MILLLGFVIIGAAWLTSYYTNLPPFTVISSDSVLAFLDDAAVRARMSRTYEIRPNYAHLSEITFGNIVADGSVEAFKWNDRPLSESEIEYVIGEYRATVRFGAPLRSGKPFKGTLSNEFVNSFPARTEYILYVTDFPTKLAKITVRMPAGRHCSSVRAYKVQGADKTMIREPEVTDDGITIQLILKRPPLGRHAIYWDW